MFETQWISGSELQPHRLIEFLRPPFRKFEFLSPMSPAHAARVLEEIVEPPRKWGWRTSAKRGYFEGRVAGGRFRILRVSRNPTSFMPIIEGNLRRDRFGTLVTLNMRLLWPIVPVWMCAILFLAWGCIAVDSPLAGPFAVRMVVIAMTLIIYLAATVPFALEVRAALSRLLKLMRCGSGGSGFSF